MKTALIFGYPNKPGKKRYSYHGLEKDCLIQRDPDPFEEIPLIIPGLFWELVIDVAFSGGTYYMVESRSLPLLFSSDDNPCYDYSPYWHKRYYFFELKYYPAYSPPFSRYFYMNGSKCKEEVVIGDGSYVYHKRLAEMWGFTGYVMLVGYPGPGCHIRMWRSSTGENPGYDPT